MERIKPFSDNIIFFDTEFSSLDSRRGELLSIGMVKMNGEELYLELESTIESDEWVKDNVIPLLTGEKVNLAEALEKMKKFAGDTKPFLLSYIDNYDAVYLKNIIGQDKDNIFNWITIDVSSICFALGLDPQTFGNADTDGTFDKLGIDWKKYREHHALDDAKLLREFYIKYFSLSQQ
jgi:DNA polymerase III alpha subunit (gram-positive type)